jgi:glycosyltransferase involved in cell wall biosynthesis
MSCELTIVMPCLNEAETVETCVRKAARWMKEAGVKGEIIVADNGSHDGSQDLAVAAGARVVAVAEKGYGSALMAGVAAARSKYMSLWGMRMTATISAD